MKKIILLFSLLILGSLHSFAQERKDSTGRMFLAYTLGPSYQSFASYSKLTPAWNISGGVKVGYEKPTRWEGQSINFSLGFQGGAAFKNNTAQTPTVFRCTVFIEAAYAFPITIGRIIPFVDFGYIYTKPTGGTFSAIGATLNLPLKKIELTFTPRILYSTGFICPELLIGLQHYLW